jgi:hypothetical protein
MATGNQSERQQVIDASASELAEVGLTADLAIARHDWDCIYSASDRLLELQRSWAGLYRRLLVLRVAPSRISERSSV